MSWWVTVHAARKRALTKNERTAMAQHVETWAGRDWEIMPYALKVPPKKDPSGLIAFGSMQLPLDPEGEDIESLMLALTDLRETLPGAELRVEDDQGLVGWDDGLGCFELIPDTQQPELAEFEPGKDWIDAWDGTPTGADDPFEAAPDDIRASARKARDITDWSFVAGDVRDELDDDDLVVICLKKAAGLARDGFDWASVAEAWNKHLPGDERVREVLGRAEDLAETGIEWSNVIKQWHEARDSEAAERCLRRAEDSVEESDDFSRLGTAWFKQFDQPDETRRCLVEATRRAAETVDWCVAAQVYEKLDQADDIRRCLEEGEKVADSGQDFEFLSREYQDLLKDAAESKRCRRRAKKLPY
jgi:hypothetical protein